MWSDFRRWASVEWGTSPELPISRLADDLWLLDVSSKEEVSRIVALGKWRFGNILLQLDGWIKDTGRSTVSAEKGVVWILVSGIPVHLRSSALLQSLGELCGAFLGSEKAGDLNSARIKVRMLNEVPSTVTLKYGADLFKISLSVELAQGSPSASSRAEAPRSSPVPSKSLVLSSQATVCVDVADADSVPIPAAMELTVEESFGQSALACQVDTFLPRTTERTSGLISRGRLFVGLRLDSNGFSVCVPRFQSEQLVIMKDLIFSAGLVAPRPCPSQPKVLNFSLGPWAFPNVIFSELAFDTSSSLGFGSTLLLDSFSSQVSPISAGGSLTTNVMLASDSQSVDLGVSSVEAEVREVSDLLGLELNDSLEAGSNVAVATCKKVWKRRTTPSPRSKLEREQRRLGIENGSTPVTGSRGSNSNRFACTTQIDFNV
ncbi:hypothetical protein LINPERPRIM_LOCUS15437 [Linum perenne]